MRVLMMRRKERRRPLAVLRPVFRGLRLPDRTRSLARALAPCSAETRFQGIATAANPPGIPNQASPCSAETRFQGIATSSDPAGLPFATRHSACSAETRFQGIATLPPLDSIGGGHNHILQC